jgi:two-component system, NarL family, response regulator
MERRQPGAVPQPAESRLWVLSPSEKEDLTDERRCLVIDEQPAVRQGVRGLLGDRWEVEEAKDGREAIDMITTVGDFDVAIVELAPMANGDGSPLRGIGAIRALRKARPGLGIVAHATRPERHAASEAIGAGATAYVAKNSPAAQLSRAVDAAADAETFVDPAARKSNGSQSLTRRQREILQLYADGLSTDDAADKLGLSTETIRSHTKGLLARLAARDRAHAVAIALRNSLIE